MHIMQAWHAHPWAFLWLVPVVFASYTLYIFIPQLGKHLRQESQSLLLTESSVVKQNAMILEDHKRDLAEKEQEILQIEREVETLVQAPTETNVDDRICRWEQIASKNIRLDGLRRDRDQIKDIINNL